MLLEIFIGKDDGLILLNKEPSCFVQKNTLGIFLHLGDFLVGKELVIQGGGPEFRCPACL